MKGTSTMKRILHRLRRDDRGVYAVELAMILPTFLLLIMGIFDIGFQMYAKSVLAGAVEEAARSSTLESNNLSQTNVDQEVREAVGGVASYASLSFSRTNYRNFSNVGQRETFTDTNNNGVRNAGECYEDRNANNTWDAVSTGGAGQGGADDVVLYRVTMSYDRVFPLWKILGEPQNHSIVVSTVLRNQPFNVQTSAQVVCT
jgi:Flp pilus assembly protein TadG